MSHADKHIIETYTSLFEGLSTSNKLELLASLSKSIKKEKSSKDEEFYKSFGAFSSEKSAEEIITDIRSSRHFRDKEIHF